MQPTLALSSATAQFAEPRQTPRGEDAAQLTLRLPAEPRSVFAGRQALSQFLLRERIDGIDPERPRTAVSEAIGNAVNHAYRGRSEGPVELRAERTDDGLLVQVADEGVGMTPHIDGPGAGLGLALIGRVSDRFEITEGPGVTIRMFFLSR